MSTITSEQDMTVQQGGGGTAAAAAEVANPFAAFKTEVSTTEQARLDTVEAEKKAAEAAKPAAKEAAAATDHENVIEEGDEGEEETELPSEATTKPAEKSSFQKRIDKFRRATTEAETRAQKAERELAEERAKNAGEKKSTPAPSTKGDKSWKDDPTAPKPADYPYGEVDPDFTVALTDWRNAQHDARRAEEAKTTSARSAAEAEASKQNAQWEARAESAVEKYPDFVDVVYATVEGKPAWPASATISRLIKSSEQGPDVAYYLAKNVKVAQKIAALPPEQQAAEFGVLKARFMAAAKPKGEVSAAPPPPKDTATGKGGTPPSASSSSDFAAFEKQVKAQKAAATGR